MAVIYDNTRGIFLDLTKIMKEHFVTPICLLSNGVKVGLGLTTAQDARG